MISPSSLIRGHIYLFKGEQLRYLNQNKGGYVFANSANARLELSEESVVKRLEQCKNFAEN